MDDEDTFFETYVETGDLMAAAAAARIHPLTKYTALQFISRPTVMKKLEQHIDATLMLQRFELAVSVKKAMLAVLETLDQARGMTRLRAAEMIMEYAGLRDDKPAPVVIELNVSSAIEEAEKRLLEYRQAPSSSTPLERSIVEVPQQEFHEQG